MMKRVAILVSGNGSNAENIYDYFKNNDHVEVALLVSSSPTAYALERAQRMGVTSVVLDRRKFQNSQELLDILIALNINYLILAGFLWLIPEYLIQNFYNKIINIHPALLPKYGGKGMYGNNVHQAVKNNLDHETGITIHLVNEKYDDGEILFQKACSISDTDDIDKIASKVHQLEYKYFPKIIEEWILGTLDTPDRV